MFSFVYTLEADSLYPARPIVMRRKTTGSPSSQVWGMTMGERYEFEQRFDARIERGLAGGETT